MTNDQRIALLEQSVAELRGMIAQWVQEHQQHTLSPGNALDVCVRVVSRQLLIPRHEILGTCREQPIVWARWAVMWLLHSRFKISANRIGLLFGKDHNSVCHAIRRLPSLRDQCRSLSLGVTACERELDAMLQPTTQEHQAAA